MSPTDIMILLQKKTQYLNKRPKLNDNHIDDELSFLLLQLQI
jgi:hypothetical protein